MFFFLEFHVLIEEHQTDMEKVEKSNFFQNYAYKSICWRKMVKNADSSAEMLKKVLKKLETIGYTLSILIKNDNF